MVETNIVHIAAHYGGGVGAVTKNLVVGLSNSNIKNTLIALDRMQENVFSNLGIECVDECWKKKQYMQERIAGADIVLVHYWNHPLMSVFFHLVEFHHSRVLSWIHVSGLSCLNRIPSLIYQKSSLVIYTSDISLKLHKNGKHNFSNIATIHSVRDLKNFYCYDPIKKIVPLKRLVYVGTISSQKMHEKSPEIFQLLASMGFELTIVGEDKDNWLKKKILDHQNIIFTGKICNVAGIMRQSDIFIYPLRNDHYGTGEQVILEALASRLPVIAMNNPAEVEILADSGASLLANSMEEFIQDVKWLSQNQINYDAMSKSAFEHVLNRFSAEQMIKSFQNIVSDFDQRSLKKIDSSAKDFSEELVFDIFLENAFTQRQIRELRQCLDPLGRIVDILENNNILDAMRKGSPHHYLSYFSQSEVMSQLCQLIDRRRNEQ